jgi:hypothetical protein
MGYEAFTNARDASLRNIDDSMAALEGGRQARVNRTAGNALQAGDYDGASGALYAGGNLRDGMAVQNAGRARQTADMDQQRAAIAAAVSGLLHVPVDQRQAMLQSRIGPVFQELGLGEYLTQIRPEDLSDQSLRGLAASLGGEVPQNTIYNTRDGIVERDPFSGNYSMGYQVKPAEQAAPIGYRWTNEGGLEAVPGGPADPSVIGTRAAAGRAPQRPRSGNVSAPRSNNPPARPSRPPWERF